MVLVLENHDYRAVVGAGDAPYINHLIASGGLATDAYGQSHPSLPNYLALIAGSTFGITSDCTQCMVSGPTIVDQLQQKHLSWRAYMESMPSPCYAGAGVDSGYARKHDPFLYFPQIAGDARTCADVMPMTAMLGELDAAAPPDYVFAVPNLCDDGHDCDLSVTDGWMAHTMPAVLSSRWYADNGVVIVTWDEGTAGSCCNGADGGHIVTLVLSHVTPPGARMSQPVDHAGTLRTVEALFGLPYLADAACACSGSLLPLLPGLPAR